MLLLQLPLIKATTASQVATQITVVVDVVFNIQLVAGNIAVSSDVGSESVILCIGNC